MGASPHLVLQVAFNNINWEALYFNLSKAQWQWGMVTNVLTNTGAMVRAREMMYKELVHTVLIYGRDSWVAT